MTLKLNTVTTFAAVLAMAIAGVCHRYRQFLQGSSNGTKNASFEIRKATRSHAFGAPVPREGRSPNRPADEKYKSAERTWVVE
jgi:hypothetical protein